MKYPFLFLIICSIFHFSCTMLNNENKDKTITPNPPVELPPFEMELPEGYTIAKQASGDLNKDGAEEKVLVVNTGEMGDMGEERVILIFKVENKEWKLWHRSSGTILPSEHGGMMGDPLQSVSVEKGAIVINHFGGSRSKWDHTHRFRYQNNKWELIGVTLISGTPCVDREKFDYNLSSGRVIYSDVVQVCDQGDEPRTRSIRSKAGFVSKMESLPQMNGFVHGKIFATNPRTGNCVPKDRCYDVIDTTAGNTNENNTSTEAPISETKEEPITSPTNQPKEDLLDLKELFGIYTYSKNDQSWILTIFPEEREIEVSFYEVAGVLADLDQIIAQYEPQILQKFEINKKDNKINSDLGKGQYKEAGDNSTITFFDVNNKLVLTRNDFSF